MQASFSDIEKSIQNQGLLQLFSYTSQTTTTTTYTRSQEIDTTSENDITQDFFVKDTNQGQNVALFYDALFGTFAFLPWPTDMGVAHACPLRHLPVIAWSVRVNRNAPVRETMPRELHERIRSLGGSLLIAAPANSYTVSRTVAKGMPGGFAKVGFGVRGTFLGNQNHQALYYAVNSRRHKVAQVWINFVVR